MRIATLTTILTLALSTGVQAEGDYDCEAVAGQAELVMKARQVGVSLSEALEAVGDNEMGRVMVINAYELSRMHTEEYQQRMISDYRNLWHLACLKS